MVSYMNQGVIEGTSIIQLNFLIMKCLWNKIF